MEKYQLKLQKSNSLEIEFNKHGASYNENGDEEWNIFDNKISH